VTRHGIDPNRVSWEGKGQRDLYDTQNPYDPLNRRVTIQTMAN
jgi:flagellar motor protein MotB